MFLFLFYLFIFIYSASYRLFYVTRCSDRLQTSPLSFLVLTSSYSRQTAVQLMSLGNLLTLLGL